MQDANFVTIFGAVSQEPRMVGNEYKRCFMSIGGIQNIGTREMTFFQEVRAGGDEGKFAGRIPAGTPVVVKGTLRHETWEDSKTGEKKSASYVRATSIRQLPNPEQYAVERRTSKEGNEYYLMSRGAYISVAIEGNLARADLRYLADGTPVLGGSFACKEEYIQNGETKTHTNWFEFTVWGEEADRLAAEGIGKGWSIAVQNGMIRNSTSVSKTNGKTYKNTSIEQGQGRMSFLPKRGGTGGGSMDIDAALDMPDMDVDSPLPF